MAESSSNKEITVVLEVKLSGIHESFDVTVEPGSYVSELITDTLDQCNVTDVKPENCQLLLLSKTTVIPLEDEDLFNSISTTSDKESKLLLKEVEGNIHILKVYFHKRDDCRIKYSFIVDEKTTTDIINKSMATKLDLDNAQHSYKLINCVPAGDECELQPNDIPFLMSTDYLEFRVYEKSPSLKRPSKTMRRNLKQLKNQTKQKTFTLPSPPSMATNAELLLSPIATSTSLSPAAQYHTTQSPHEVSSSYNTIGMVASSSRSSSTVAVQTNKDMQSMSVLPSSSAVSTSVNNDTTGKVIPMPDHHSEAMTEMSARHERIIQSLESELAKQYNRVHDIETELQKANSSLQAKDQQIFQYKRESDISMAEKQQAIDTLSDLLQSEQEENEQLRNDFLKQSGSLYQDLAMGRVGLAVEIEAATSHIENFNYEIVTAPVSCNGSYIVVNKVQPGFNKLVVGDIILEVNGYSCRGANTIDRAMQILDECSDEILHLAIARSQPEPFEPSFSTPRLVSTDIPIPIPSSPAPTSASTDSLDPPPLPFSPAPQFASTDSLDPPPLPFSPAPQFASTDSLDPPPLPFSPAPQFASTDSLDPPPLPFSPATQFASTDSLDPPPLPLSPAPRIVSTDSLDSPQLPPLSNFTDKRGNIRHEEETMALEKEIKHLQSVIKASEKREKEIFEEMELARRKSSETLAQVVKLDKLLKDERYEKERYVKQFREAENVNSDITQERNHLQYQLQSESAKLEQLEKGNKSLHQRLAEEKESFDSHKLRYEEELKEMRSQLKEKEELAKLKQLEKGNKSLHQRLAEEKESFDSHKLKYEEELKEMRSRLKEKEDELISVKKMTEDNSSSLVAQRELDEFKQLSKEKEQLEAKLQVKQLENDQILFNIKETKAANEKMIAQLADSQKQLEGISVKYAEINKQAQEFKKDLEDLEEEKNALLKEIEDKKIVQEEHEQKYLNEKKKVLELEKIKVDHQKIIHEKERELENAKKDNESLELKIQTLEALRQERLTLLESDLNNSRKQSDRREDTIAEKDDRISQLHFSLKELTLEQQKDIQQRMKQLEDTQQELLVYKEKAHISEVDKKLQQEKLASLDNDVQMLKKQLEKKDNAIAEKDGQITELHLSLKEVNAELRASQKQVFNEKERLVEFTEKTEKMKIELAKSEVEQEKLKQQVLELKQNNENIGKECDSVKKEKEISERNLIKLTSELNKERDDSAMEKKQLKHEIEDLNTKMQHHKSLLETSQKETSQYKEKIDKLISTMEQDLASVKQQSEKKDESVTEKDVLIAKLNTVLDERNTEITTLQDQLKNQTVEVHTLTDSLKSASNTITSLQSTNEESSTEIQRLETETKKWSNDVNQLQKEISEFKKAEEKSDLLKEQLSKRNNELQLALEEKVREEEMRLKAHINEVEGLQGEIDQLKEHVSEFKGRCTTLTHELSEQKDITQRERANMETEKKEMAMKLTSLEQQLSAANGELTLQKNSYITLESKTNNLYEQLGYFKSDKEKIDEKLINVVQEKERLKHELESTKTDFMKRFDESQRLLVEKETEIKSKVGELEHSKQALEKANNDLKKLEAKLEQATKESEQKLQDISIKHDRELKETRDEIERLHNEITTLQSNQSSLTEELNSSKKLIENISEEKTKLIQSVEEMQIALSDLEKTSSNDLESERNQYLANIERLEKENERKQKEIQEKYLKTETEVRNELQRQLDESESSKKALMGEIDKHKAELAKKMNEIESMNNYIDKLLPVVMEFKPSVLSTKQSSLSSSSLRY